MRGRYFWLGLRLVGLLTVSVAGAATALEELVDVTVAVPGTGGIDWVVEDPVGRYLIAGSGFSQRGGFELIGDKRDGFAQVRVDWNVGESLYVALHSQELQGRHPGMRRVFIATENSGRFGYFDAATNILSELSPSPGNQCGTSIGYRPDLDTVYFNFVACDVTVVGTQIHKYVISTGQTFYNISPGFPLSDLNVHGPWVMMNTPDGPRLWSAAHKPGTEQICVVQQELDDAVYTELNCFPQGPDPFGPYFNNAKFAGGFYYSEFDRFANTASAYRVVETATGFSRRQTSIRIPEQQVRSPITAKTFTFLEDTVRNQIFAL